MSRREREQEQAVPDPVQVERIAEILREPVPVRAEWRAALLRGVVHLPAPPGQAVERRDRRWQLRPITAIAAGLMCAVVGAVVATLAMHGRRLVPPDALTSLTATMPLPGEMTAAGGRSTVRFVLVAPYASRVSLVGDFNGWNPSTMPMRRSIDGRAWLLDVPLAPGRHVYSFVIDGDLAPDPAAPRAGDDDFGVPSSVVLVSGSKT
jgi:predicted carbohydrate-binding protein with CBM48